VLAKQQCQTCGLWFDDRDFDSHLNQHLENEVAVDERRELNINCLVCNKVMEIYYGVPFRVGGTGPGMRALIGAWAEFGEEPIPIDLYFCTKCGRMQLLAGAKTRDRLKRSAPHKP